MKKLLLILIIGMFLISGVSAFDFDNVKSYDKENDKITINNAFNLPFIGSKLAEYTLTSNTDQCLIDCYSEGEATLYTKGYLFSDLKFKNSVGKNTELQNKMLIEVIETYQETVQDGEEVCAWVEKNQTTECNYQVTGTHEEDRTRIYWDEYQGQVLDEGTYRWRIEGKKDKDESIDWVAESFGEKFTEWAWWNAAWVKRKPINITGGDSLLTNFTVILNISYDSDMQADFDDIRLVNGSCDGIQTTELDFEIDTINSGINELVWVKIPDLASGNNQHCLYYNNVGASTGEDRTNAWDDNYLSIYHFSNAAGTLVNDSIGSGNGDGNGTHIGTVSWVADAFGGTSNDFDGNEGVSIDAGTNIDVTSSSITVETWVSKDSGDAMIGAAANNGWQFTTSGNTLQIRKPGISSLQASDDVTISSWQYWAMSYDQTGNLMSFYQNQSPDSGNTQAYSDEFSSVAYFIADSIVDIIDFNGRLDEIRVSSTNRSDAWLKRSFENGNFSNFIFGDELIVTSSIALTSLHSPLDSFSSVIGDSISFNASVTPTHSNITNITLYIWNSSGYNINLTTNDLTGEVFNSTIWENVFNTAGTFNWSAFGCVDNIGFGVNCTFATANRTFIISSFTENSQTFNSSAIETDLENFKINLTVGSSITGVSASLNYNGTSYVGVQDIVNGKEYIFSRNIDVPLIDKDQGNHTFFWALSLTDASSTFTQNSNLNNQTIAELLYSNCSDTESARKFANFTVKDEETLLDLDVDFMSGFNFYLGTGTVIENSSYTADVQNSSFQLCGNINDTYVVDSIINVDTTGYTERNYFFDNDSLNNGSTLKRNLYLINEGNGSNIIIQVTDAGLAPLEGYVVQIERYYPSTNSFVEIISDQTDEFGQIVARLVEDTVKYKFKFTDPYGVLQKETGQITVACRTVFCVIPFVIEDTTDDFARFSNVTDFESLLSFNDITNTYSFSWNDLTGDSATVRLIVERTLMNGTTIVCNTTSAIATSTLTCGVGSSRASYKGQTYRRIGSGDERRISFLNVEVGDLTDLFGLEGLIWAFFLLFTLIAVGSFNPTAGVVLYMVGFIGLGMMDIIKFNPAVFFSTLVIGVVFIWCLKR